MNLYRTKFSHHAPRDMQTGTICLILAENDKQVYEFLKSEPKINDEQYFVSWQDREDDEEVVESEWNDKYEATKVENIKDYLIRIKGSMNDQNQEYNDLYYGLTVVGWELLKEDVKTDYSELIELGQMFKLNP